MIYTDEIAEFVRLLGFVGILAEGWDPLMNGKSSNYLYYAKKTTLEPKIQKIAEKNCISKRKLPKIRVLLKNYKLSDDVAFRFSDRTWNEYPLTAEKFVEWILKSPGNTINLFVDYETFGEHQWESTGIFKFLEDLPLQFKKLNIGFKTPIETINSYRPAFEFSSEKPLSWADESRDLSAWMGNKLQKTAMKNLYELEYKIYNLKKPDKKSVLLEFWRRLQTSDHFYYMSTKYWNDGDVHKYFSPYDSPYDAYINFMNVLNELVEKIEKEA